MVTLSVRADNFLGIFEPAPPPPGQTIAGLPFSDDFESGSLAAWNSVGGTVGITTLEAFNGVRSAFTEVLAGNQSDNYLERHFGDHQGVNGTPMGMNDLWCRFAHKWDAAYVDSDPTMVAQKLLLINGQNPATNIRRYQTTFNIFNTAAGANNNLYFFDLYRWNENGTFGGTLHNIIVPNFTRVKGRWEEFVFRLRMNTPGLVDGHLQCWTKAEGDTAYVERINRTNLNHRDATSITLNRFIGLSNFDTFTTRNGRRYWDIPTLQQEPIDVSADPPPADNDGLIVTNFATFDAEAAPIISLDINAGIPTSTSNGGSVSVANEVWWNGSSVPVATIRPPTVGDSYAGFGGVYFWKNGAFQIRQFNMRWEWRASDLACLNTAGLPKWVILICPKEPIQADGIPYDRPMLYLTHMTEADNVGIHVANALTLAPAQGTMRMFSDIDYIPAPDEDHGLGGGQINTYCNMRQPWYIRATSGVDGAGNPIIDNDEIICMEMRVQMMSTVDEPDGVIGYKLTRRNGNTFTRCCAFTYWPEPPGGVFVNDNYLSHIDVMGGGYYNLANSGDTNHWHKMGRRLTFGFNLGPTVGRYWIGPPTGFVQV